MDEKVITALKTDIRRRLATSRYRKLVITWYGAEPTTAPRIISEISNLLIRICEEFGVSYEARLITNGFGLSQPIAMTLLQDSQISLVTISLDGPQAVHDARRPSKGGAGTYRKIVSNLQGLAACEALGNVRLRVRINIDAGNASFVHALIEELSDLGLAERVEVDLAVVVPWSEKIGDLLGRPTFADYEISWLSHLIYRGFRTSLLPTPKPSPCLAADPNAFVVAFDGMAHNCAMTPHAPHAITETTEILGAITDVTTELLESRHDLISDSILSDKHPCSKCHFLFTCQGGCPKELDMGLLPCPSYKFNIQSRLQLQALKTRFDSKLQDIVVIADNQHVRNLVARALGRFQAVFSLFRCSTELIIVPSSSAARPQANNHAAHSAWTIPASSGMDVENESLFLEYFAGAYLHQLNPLLAESSSSFALEITESFTIWATAKVLKTPTPNQASKLTALANLHCIEHFLSLPVEKIAEVWANISVSSIGRSNNSLTPLPILQ